jgi:hypothetical protein
MATDNIIELLIAERDRIDRAIEALQGPKRRGRPPKDIALETQTAPPAPRKKRNFSKAQRAAAAERMRRYWAARRKKG